MKNRTSDSISRDYDSELSQMANEAPIVHYASKWERIREAEDRRAIWRGIRNGLLLSCVFWAIVLFAITCRPRVAFPMDVVIETIAREASGESLAAQTYVAAVIRQRAKERHQTYEEVCKAPFQFSCWNKGTKQKPRTAKEYETARRAWELSVNVADKPNLYHDTSVWPQWAFARTVHFVKAIGRLRFYREDV